jgi:hypothetical protein
VPRELSTHMSCIRSRREQGSSSGTYCTTSILQARWVDGQRPSLVIFISILHDCRSCCGPYAQYESTHIYTTGAALHIEAITLCVPSCHPALYCTLLHWTRIYLPLHHPSEPPRTTPIPPIPLPGARVERCCRDSEVCHRA